MDRARSTWRIRMSAKEIEEKDTAVDRQLLFDE